MTDCLANASCVELKEVYSVCSAMAASNRPPSFKDVYGGEVRVPVQAELVCAVLGSLSVTSVTVVTVDQRGLGVIVNTYRDICCVHCPVSMIKE